MWKLVKSSEYIKHFLLSKGAGRGRKATRSRKVNYFQNVTALPRGVVGDTIGITGGGFSRPLAKTTKGAAVRSCSPLSKNQFHCVHRPLPTEDAHSGMKRLPQNASKAQPLRRSETAPPKGCACFWGASCRRMAGVQGMVPRMEASCQKTTCPHPLPSPRPLTASPKSAS